MADKKKILLLTYYWPPSGGSGVQRWMYFAKYLKEFGYTVHVVTVDEKQASYKFLDKSFNERVEGIPVTRTKTFEPLKLYSKISGGDERRAIPQGFAGEQKLTLFKKLSRFVRGNFFIPDARIGWNKYAWKAVKELLQKESFDVLITTGPPHSTHLVGLKANQQFGMKWLADFRDPWLEVYYNKLMYRTNWADKKDAKLEQQVLGKADIVLTIGPSMQELLQQKVADKEKVKFIYNGFDEELFKRAEPEIEQDKFTIRYIGLVSDLHRLEGVFKALQDLKKAGAFSIPLEVQFWGEVSESRIKKLAALAPDVPVKKFSYVPHQRAINLMCGANILLNSFPEMEMNKIMVTGKLMEYIASGRPIICIGDPESDGAKVLERLDNAAVFGNHDVQGILQFLKKELNREYPTPNQFLLTLDRRQKFSRSRQAHQLAELI